jgi:hypothetical protein
MGILDSIMTPVSEAKDPLAEREKWLQMSQLFNSFTMNPEDSRGYYEGQERGIARQRDAAALKSKELTSSNSLAAQTAQALKLIGTKYPDIAQAIQGGFMTPKEGMQEVMRRKNLPANESFTTITGADATAKGLDPSRSYNVSSTTGKITGIGAGGTTIINEASAPDQDELYKVLAKNEAEQWGGFLEAGSKAASVIPDITMLGELLAMAPSGPVQGRLAQTFSGFNNAADAAKAIINRLAPSMRVAGSGSTSDIEVKMMMDSLGSLINQSGANALIHQAFKAKLNLDIQRQSIVRKVQSRTLTADQGREELNKLDQVSILPDALRGRISADAASSIQAGGIPAGISKKKWDSLTQKQKDSISGLFTQ